MKKALEVLEKIPLSVALIVNCLNQGKTQTQIAQFCGCTFQAVSDYKIRHSEQINALLDKSESIQIIQHKLNVQKASRNLEKCLESATSKKDIIANVAVIDRLTPVYRLLSGASTQNIAFASFVKEVSGNTKQALIESAKSRQTVKKTDTPEEEL